MRAEWLKNQLNWHIADRSVNRRSLCVAKRALKTWPGPRINLSDDRIYRETFPKGDHARTFDRHNTPPGVRIIKIRMRGRWLLLEKGGGGAERARVSGRIRGGQAFYPIFLRVIKYSAHGSRVTAGTGERGTFVAGVAERVRGIMGSNGEKLEGLYQWELVAVCPSNGAQAPPTMLDNAPEEPMVNRPNVSLSFSLVGLFLFLSLCLCHCYAWCLSASLFLDGQRASRAYAAAWKVQTPPQLRVAFSYSLSLGVSLSSSHLCLFLSSWPTDQQTAAHAPVVDTILEHWLSARSTRRSRDIRPTILCRRPRSRIWCISEIQFHCLIFLWRVHQELRNHKGYIFLNAFVTVADLSWTQYINSQSV